MDYEMAQLFAQLSGQALAKLEQKWRREIEAKLLPVNTTLRPALNKLPAIWIDAICLCLGVLAERKRQDKVTHIISYLSDETNLTTAVTALAPHYREAMAYVLNSGGWVKYGELSRKFGDEKGDGWWWDKNPPQSTIGQLRLRGLLFVGQTPMGSRHYKVAVIPNELREPLIKTLDTVSSSREAGSLVKPVDARFYQALNTQLSELKFQYATFATEDEKLKRYYERFMAYWSKTDYAKYEAAEGFGVEEYLWNFRLPVSDKFLLDCFLEQRGDEIQVELKSGFLNWRDAELRCCRILAVKDMLLLEDMDNGTRMWCFSLNIGGVKAFRGSVGKVVMSYVSPWDNATRCLLGYSVVLPAERHFIEVYQNLKYTLRDTTARTRRYFARATRKQQSGLPEIPEVFLRAFKEERTMGILQKANMDRVQRYKMYRKANKDLNHKIMESCLERDVMMKSAKLLGIARGDTLMFDSMDETNVLMDFALNEYKVKGKNAIEIYRETANYNEVEMDILNALLSSYTSLFEVISISRAENSLLLNDVMNRRENIRLTDIALSESAVPGLLLFVRLVPFTDFNMTSGISFAFDPDLKGYLLRRHRKLGKKIEVEDDSTKRFISFFKLSKTDGLEVKYE